MKPIVDLSDVEVISAGEWEPLPEGAYLMQAQEAELKKTKAGDGSYIKVKFQVVEGDHNRRVVFHNFNIANPSPKATEIGKQQLKSFLIASGVPEEKAKSLGSVTALEGLSASCYVKQERSEQYGSQNRITSFKKWESGGSAKAQKTKPAPQKFKPTTPATDDTDDESAKYF